MQKQIIECVPNFSEAQRPEVIEKIKKDIIRTMRYFARPAPG
jgi:glutamate formiminotransferase